MMASTWKNRVLHYFSSRRILGHILELLIISALVTLARLLFVWMSKEISPSLFYLSMETSLIPRLGNELGTSVLPALLCLVPALVFSRLFRVRSWFLLFSLGLPTLILLVILYNNFLPVVRMVKSDMAQIPEYSPSLSVPVSIMLPLLRKPLELLIPFLAGLYCSRHGFRLWKFMLGFWGTGWILKMMFHGVSGNWFLQSLEPALYLGVGLVALYLPLQRSAFERLFGMSFEALPTETPRSRDSVLSSFLGHGAVIVLLVLSLFFGLFGYVERKAFRTIQFGPEPSYRSPALVNAYPVLKSHFTRNTSPILPLRQSFKEYPHSFYAYAADVMPAKTLTEFLGKLDEVELEAQFKEIEPYLVSLKTASCADYLLYHEADRLVMPQFINFRELARLMALRASLRINQGRFEEAIKDINVILRTGWLLNSDGQNMVTYMVGTAIRGVGISAATNYFLCLRDNPQAMTVLEAQLAEWKRLMHVEFELEKIQRGEPGLWPIAPWYEIAVTGFLRARAVHYARWVDYDRLVLAIALEKYKAARGEYPETLEALEPEWIERLPREPYEGKSYSYERQEGEYRLACPWKSSYYTFKDFPPREPDERLVGFLKRENPPPSKPKAGVPNE
jgi:hypothetical protein